MKHTHKIVFLALFFILLQPRIMAFAAERLVLENDGTRSFSARTIVIDQRDSGQNLVLKFGNSLNEQIYWNASMSKFVVTDDLDVQGTLSGAALHAEGTISASGSLSVEAGIFGAGLSDCDNATTSKLLWDASTGKFSCGTDQTGAGTGDWSGTGALQTAFDARYVNQSGDTMTGGLLIDVGNGNESNTIDSGLALEVVGTASGEHLHFGRLLTGSGAVKIQNITDSITSFQVLDANGGTTVFNIDTVNERVGIGNDAPTYELDVTGDIRALNDIYVAERITNDGDIDTYIDYGDDDIISLFVGGVKFLALTESTTDELTGNPNTLDLDFVWNGDTNTNVFRIDAANERVGIGTAAPETALDVVGTVSGSQIHASALLTSSGAISADGSIFTDNNLFLNSLNAAQNAVITFGSSGGQKTLTFDNNSHRFQLNDSLSIFNDSEEPSTISGSLIISEFGTTNNGLLLTSDSNTHVITGANNIASVLECSNCSRNSIYSYAWGKGDGIGAGNTTAYLAELKTTTDTDPGVAYGLRVIDDIASDGGSLYGVFIDFDDPDPTSTAIHVENGVSRFKDDVEVSATLSGTTLRVGGGTMNVDSTGTVTGATISASKNTLHLSGALVWYIDGTIATGASQSLTFTLPVNFRPTAVEMHVDTAPTGQSLIIDINEGGTTIFSTRPEIDASATTEDGNHVFSDTSLAIGSEITLDVDQIGSGTAGADITIQLYGSYDM